MSSAQSRHLSETLPRLPLSAAVRRTKSEFATDETLTLTLVVTKNAGMSMNELNIEDWQGADNNTLLQTVAAKRSSSSIPACCFNKKRRVRVQTITCKFWKDTHCAPSRKSTKCICSIFSFFKSSNCRLFSNSSLMVAWMLASPLSNAPCNESTDVFNSASWFLMSAVACCMSLAWSSSLDRMSQHTKMVYTEAAACNRRPLPQYRKHVKIIGSGFVLISRWQ
jgi:hypothetical protein